MTKEKGDIPNVAKIDVSGVDATQRVNEIRRFLRIFLGRPVVILGVIIILLVLICAAFPDWLAPHDPHKHDYANVLAQPSSEHWLGTDRLGRDLLSRVIFGARTALVVGISAVSIGGVIGMVLGLVAGYFGRITYAAIMRFIDALMAFPPMILTLFIAALLGGGVKMVVIALGIGMMPGYARIMCGQAMSIRENDYILASRSLGANNFRIMLRHLLPNAFPPMIVMLTMMIGITILAEAGLSYLGIGINDPTIAWGSLVNRGYADLLSNPLLSTAPGVAIIITVFAFNMVGDGLRDAIDPRLRGVL